MSTATKPDFHQKSLNEIRDDFLILRRQEPPVTIDLMHRATNAAAEGVTDLPRIHFGLPAAGCGAGWRGPMQKCDEAGNPLYVATAVLDVKGAEIRDRTGKAPDIALPTHRQVTFYGTVDAVSRLRAAATRAGKIVGSVGTGKYVPLLSGWQFNDDAEHWWALLFEAAWLRLRPELSAERRIWRVCKSKTLLLPYDQAELRSLESLFPGRNSIPARWFQRMPDAYVSTIDDAASASVALVDALLDELVAPAADAGRKAAEGNAIISGDPWLTVTQAAELLMKDVPHLDLGAARARVSKAAAKGKFKTNEKKCTARRIDPGSFAVWRLAQRDRGLDAEDKRVNATSLHFKARSARCTPR